MTDALTILSQKIGDHNVHRRQFTKRDGRDMFFYGYLPHEEQPLPEAEGEVAKGGELRWHPLRHEWNLYAPHRQHRTFKPSAADDPLSPSRPGQPPTEIPFTDFELVVFENKFTSLHAQAPPPSTIAGIDLARAKGRCDVVVYAPEGRGSLATIGQAKRRLLLAAWMDRYETLYSQGHKFVMPFENRGDEVGVTLHHPHGQIYAFPFIPDVQKRSARAFDEGYNLSAAMVACRGDYEVATAGDVLSYCPPFARFPFEVWIAPIKRRAGLSAFTETEMEGFAHLLGDMTRRYDEYFQRPTAYMLSLHAAPAGHEKNFHFTAQFYPLLRAPDRVKYLASVEQSTSVFTVDVMPEMAAETLRAFK